jgi:hypothetical protein
MALMVSPAGEMKVKISKISRDHDTLVVSGVIGTWDSDIYFSLREVLNLLVLSMNWNVIMLFPKLIVVLFKSILSLRIRNYFCDSS